MRRRTTRRLQRYGIAAVIAAIPLAAMCAAMTYLLNPTPKPVQLEFMPVSAIDQSSTTVGIADSDLYGMSDADIVKTFDEMQSLGVDTVRVLVPWGGVQPYDPAALGGLFAGYRDWSKVDFIVNQAASRGMAVLGVLNSTPYWGGQDGTGCLGCYGTAPDPTKFAAFAGEVASHFGDKISAYEVWNEPNYVQSWSPAIDPVAYTQVLKQAYTAIKAANADALVVAGVLGTVINFGGITMDARDFVQTMYDNGAKGFFDALSIHPYQYTTMFSQGGLTWDKPWNANSPLEQLIAIRQMMIDNGDESLKIWATEYGLPTGGPNAVTQAQQAAFIKDFLDAWSQLNYTGPSFIYTTRDQADATTENGSFGLFNYDWTAKAAAQIIKDWIAAHPTPTDPGDPATPPDLGSQLAQALQAFFAQVQAAVQNFVNNWNSMVNAIAQAIANIFNPGGAAAATVPATMQAAVAEGTTLAAKAVSENTTASTSETTASDATKSASANATATTDVAAETVSTTEKIVTTATTEATTTPTTATATKTATAPEAEASTTTKTPSDATTTTSTDATATATTSTETTTKSTTDATTKASTDTTTTKASTEDTTKTSTSAQTESREPVRTGVVVRPTKAADGDTEGKTTSNGDTSSGGTAASTSGTGESDSRGAS